MYFLERIKNLLKEPLNKRLRISLNNIKKYDPKIFTNLLIYLSSPYPNELKNPKKFPHFVVFDVRELIIFEIEKKLQEKTKKLTLLLINAIHTKNNREAFEYINLLNYFEFCDEFGTTPLWVASCSGNVEILEKILKEGANVNPQHYLKTSNPFMVESPLKTCIYKRKYYNHQTDIEEVKKYDRVIELLIEGGANTDNDMDKLLMFL